MRTTLSNHNEYELDNAIADAEKRGWTLVKKGREEKYHHSNKFHYSRRHSNEYKGVEPYGKWIAVMERG